MGAHVWGPAYLRDHLLPNFRLTGWAPGLVRRLPRLPVLHGRPGAARSSPSTPDWSGWAAIVPALIAAGLLAVSLLDRRRTVRRVAFVAGVLVAVLGIGLPYGVAFKWVTVLGRPRPARRLLRRRPARRPAVPRSGAAVDRRGGVPLQPGADVEGSTGNIIGGNVASTLAGEFSLLASASPSASSTSGSCSAGCAAAATAPRAPSSSRLTALCHVIPAIYAGAATVVAVLVSAPITWRNGCGGCSRSASSPSPSPPSGRCRSSGGAPTSTTWGGRSCRLATRASATTWRPTRSTGSWPLALVGFVVSVDPADAPRRLPRHLRRGRRRARVRVRAPGSVLERPDPALLPALHLPARRPRHRRARPAPSPCSPPAVPSAE